MPPSEHQRTPQQVLRQVFGYDAFRGPQQAIVAHVVAGGSALVLMPTGGGKSLCYQIPALCRTGVGVVISPLIALMQDQVEALLQLGVRAAAIHSGCPAAATRATWTALATNQLDLLYLSPERVLSGDTLQRLRQQSLALFAIDEAHCVSQWGHDFRPEYLQLAVLAEQFPAVPRLALTATADPRTREEIRSRLQLEAGRVFLASFDRPNIRYLVRDKDNPSRQLHNLLAEHRGEAGIVYARSRNRVDRFTRELQAAGYDAVAYHAGLEAQVRHAALERFRRRSGVVVVATIAFGMGIDKPDVRFVAHLDLPKSLEAYYQETGRAGRDGLPAVAWMVHGSGDVPQLRRFIDGSDAEPAQKRIEHGKLDALIGFTETSSCRRQLLLQHLGEHLSEPCGNCDICLEPSTAVDVTDPSRKALSAVYRCASGFGAAHLTDVLLGADTARIRALGHHNLSVHGIGRELDRGQWRSLFRQLVAAGLLRSDPERFGALAWGDRERVQRLLRGEQRLEWRLPPAKGQDRRDRSSARGAGPSPVNPGDGPLLQHLKDWRRRQATSQGVPPYVVFHDRTLVEVVQGRPACLEQLGQISGVGQVKLERYGLALLQALQEAIASLDQATAP